MKRIHHIVSIVLLVALSVAGVFFGYRYVNSDVYYLASISRSGDTTGVLLRDIPRIAEQRGAEAAVEIVGEALDQKLIGTDDCHLILHLVGHTSYRINGANFEEIAAANQNNLCLDSYLHGVEAEIAAHGDKNELMEFCAFEKRNNLINSPCYHGVGHSIFELTKSVSQSLAYCNALSGGPEPDLSDCYRGVFSEIGNQLGGYDTNSGLSIKPLHDPAQRLTAAQPYALCNGLAVKYRDDCYSQLAKLYFKPFEADPLFGVESCRTSSKYPSIVSICTHTVSALAARRIFDTGSTSQIAQYLNNVSGAQIHAALDGVEEGYRSAGVSAPSWDELCPLLETGSLRDRCSTLRS